LTVVFEAAAGFSGYQAQLVETFIGEVVVIGSVSRYRILGAK